MELRSRIEAYIVQSQLVLDSMDKKLGDVLAHSPEVIVAQAN